MKYGKILCLLCAFVALSSVAFAAFDKNKGPRVMVGEVACYGEHELHKIILENFRDTLYKKLREKEIDISVNTDWVQDTGDPKERAALKKIHMDAIAHGPLFQKEMANAEMIHYAEAVFGRDYFWNDEKLAARKQKAGLPYKISPETAEAAKAIGEKYGAKYLFFTNLTETDVELAHSIFNAEAKTFDERPKHIKVETSSFLIDTKTGMVYENHTLTEKMGRIQSIFGDYGKAMSVDDLLHAMFDVQSDKIVKDVFKNGANVLSGKETDD